MFDSVLDKIPSDVPGLKVPNHEGFLTISAGLTVVQSTFTAAKDVANVAITFAKKSKATIAFNNGVDFRKKGHANVFQNS